MIVFALLGFVPKMSNIWTPLQMCPLLAACYNSGHILVGPIVVAL